MTVLAQLVKNTESMFNDPNKLKTDEQKMGEQLKIVNGLLSRYKPEPVRVQFLENYLDSLSKTSVKAYDWAVFGESASANKEEQLFVALLAVERYVNVKKTNTTKAAVRASSVLLPAITYLTLHLPLDDIIDFYRSQLLVHYGIVFHVSQRLDWNPENLEYILSSLDGYYVKQRELIVTIFDYSNPEYVGSDADDEFKAVLLKYGFIEELGESYIVQKAQEKYGLEADLPNYCYWYSLSLGRKFEPVKLSTPDGDKKPLEQLKKVFAETMKVLTVEERKAVKIITKQTRKALRQRLDDNGKAFDEGMHQFQNYQPLFCSLVCWEIVRTQDSTPEVGDSQGVRYGALIDFLLGSLRMSAPGFMIPALFVAFTTPQQVPGWLTKYLTFEESEITEEILQETYSIPVIKERHDKQNGLVLTSYEMRNDVVLLSTSNIQQYLYRWIHEKEQNKNICLKPETVAVLLPYSGAAFFTQDELIGWWETFQPDQTGDLPGGWVSGVAEALYPSNFMDRGR